MVEVIGKYNTVKCFTDVDEGHLYNLCKYRNT